MEINKNETLSEWLYRVRSQGYSVPIPMCHGIDMAMKEMNVGFKELFDLFVKRGIIIQVGSVFIYDMRGHTVLVPEGLHKCEKCGEYKGAVKAKDLYWEGYFNKETMEKSEESYSASCLCDGIPCPKCKKNKIHRPISNTYDIESNTIWHYSSYAGMMGCDECRKKK